MAKVLKIIILYRKESAWFYFVFLRKDGIFAMQAWEVGEVSWTELKLKLNLVG